MSALDVVRITGVGISPLGTSEMIGQAMLAFHGMISDSAAAFSVRRGVNYVQLC